MLGLNEKTYEHPDVQGNLPSILRSLAKPEKLRFVRKLVSTIHMVDVVTPGGLFLGRREAFDVNLARLDRVVARTVRGLFSHHTGRRLPQAAEVRAYSEDGLRSIPSEAAGKVRALVARLLRAEAHTLGERTFTYRYAIGVDHDLVSAWFLEFYRAVRFIGMTIPFSKLTQPA